MAYSSISHIPVETVSFALSLRAGEEEKDPFDGLSEEERAQLADDGKRRGGRGPCKNKSCVEDETRYKLMLVQKMQLSRKLGELNTEYGDFDEEVSDVSARASEITAVFTDLESQLNALQPNKSKLEIQLRKLAFERRTLSVGVSKLQKTLEKLKKKEARQAIASQSQSTTSRSTIPSMEASELRIIPRDKLGNAKKHSGCLKFLPQEGRVVWSCCFMAEDDAEGCLDDHSVGVKSALVLKRRDCYHPYSMQGKVNDFLLAPWRRTAQPATPPVWPPTRRPATTSTGREDKHKHQHRQEKTREPTFSEQLKYSSSMRSTILPDAGRCQYTDATEQRQRLFDSKHNLVLDAGRFHSDARYRSDIAKAPLGKARRSLRKKNTKAFVPGNNVNKRLAMFEGLHLRNVSTAAPSSLF